ncbi:MAG: hypothetical protein AB7V04_00965 [Desulfomonilaceae bacterium]
MSVKKKVIGTMLAIGIIAMIPAAMCTEILSVHSLLGTVNSTGNSIHPLIVESNHWDSSDLTKGSSDLTKGKSCPRQFAEKAWKRDLLGMIRVGLFCPSTAYSY